MPPHFTHLDYLIVLESLWHAELMNSHLHCTEFSLPVLLFNNFICNFKGKLRSVAERRI